MDTTIPKVGERPPSHLAISSKEVNMTELRCVVINGVPFDAYSSAANGTLNFNRAVFSGTMADHAGNAAQHAKKQAGGCRENLAQPQRHARGSEPDGHGPGLAAAQNALDQDVFQSEQEIHLTDSAEQARRSVNLAHDRYRRGLDSLLVTLESQRRLFNAESQLLTTQRQRRAARVNLIQALGGPWETAPADELSMNRTPNEGAHK